MITRSLITATALLAGLGAARAAEVDSAQIRPAELRADAGGSVGLGALAGVAYYTVEPRGYHVVVTLAPRGAAPALRLEAVLAPDQSVTLSTPRAAGEPAEAVEIARAGDRVLVSAPRAAGPVREADARN